jgi:hypothetical protein
VGFDFGTSPHGLSADLQRTNQESHCLPSLDSLEDGFDFVADASQPQAAKRPLVYRNPLVLSCCRAIKAAVLKQDPHTHRLAFDDCEFLHLFYAVEHDRKKIRQAIGKGLAKSGDLRATDSLWLKLQAVMANRQLRRPA